ncbi:MAG TPA: hypothetical protein VGL72_29470 [Bryobacteraceae bacterium]
MPMTQAELARIHDEAREEFAKYPGVVGVGYGFKRIGGKWVDSVGLTVFVREKKPQANLRPEEVIPAEFKGLPTDVDVVPNVTLDSACEDHTIHSPLAGGITISNLTKDSSGNFSAGTLGFFATVNGKAGPQNIILVSNNHVLCDNAAKVGDLIYQPPLFLSGGSWGINPANRDNNSVGGIVNAGQKGDHPFTYPGETVLQYYVDCATAEVSFCVSTCCHTLCGQHFTDQIIGLALNGSNQIVDIARVQQSDLVAGTDYVVYKVGRTTGRTVGKVVMINHPVSVTTPPPPSSGNNAITIIATANNCNGELKFSDSGDSGSAIVNAQGKLIALLFGGDSSQVPKLTLASHIHPVLDFLKVTAITQANPATGNPAYSTDAVNAALAAPAAGINPTAVPALRERLNKTPEGAQIASMIESHATEVIHLVNHNRRVTVTWHRNKGPEFLNESVLNAHDPAHVIPAEIEGVTRDTLLQRMAKVLSEFGSAGLRASIGQIEWFLPRLGQFGSLRELIDSLSGTQPA